ncbi:MULTISPECIES: ABC transporter ATP-binding protein [unclassified Methanoculleus]|uniref:ABC transporter ATP-binding protein n=1 Tax=unclassified Methanoculleus TaxID=2619537 RepID=UPI0025D848B2|nr:MULTISPECIES: ABC transporter ATP-binding protein [unclassified Methanoculleus]MCK9319032.1 ABC transporter ATP-binding protein [Methanoculleus sp.]MDD2254281.1 ABC transporter ATP-binding protein [Methanoculleus sp.]MDD2786791.1 ABC transporter ATP-binding protein [Methanoculleus sp.]MDD3217150.1 ABC transporter ATP-binding protein [Methanoculleus sp.]MDD4314415.1 ABC transporter ATP-binding protein [Methanoculleus sp.]
MTVDAPSEKAATSSTPILRFEDVSKIYPLPAGDVVALDHVSLTVEPGEFIAVMGPSGSGKSTLLNMMGCLDVPTSGKIYLSGQEISRMSDDDLTRLRRDRIGFVFQQFNLIPLLSAVENVEFPLVLTAGREESRQRAIEVLRMMHLDDALFSHRPGELSGGEQQRVAIARALVNDPDLLLCDEPTGNLDSKTGTAIMGILAAENREGKTVIMVTHDPGVAAYARRTIRIVDGRLV